MSLLAQLVERCTGITEVMGSYPLRAWIFFHALFHNCEDTFYIRFFNYSAHIRFLYINSDANLLLKYDGNYVQEVDFYTMRKAQM